MSAAVMGIMVINEELTSRELIEADHQTGRTFLGRRRAGRRSCKLPARLFVSGGKRPVDCTIVDESSMGARLQLVGARASDKRSGNQTPSEFWLHFPLEKAQVKCQRVWEHNDLVGVRFWSAIQPA